MNTESDYLNQLSVAKVPDPVAYTLRIGVTGHRELHDPEAVGVAVENLLLKIKQTLERGMLDPHQPLILGDSLIQKKEIQLAWKIKRRLTLIGILPKLTKPDRQTPLRWSVISSLAMGSDRIVPQIAMKSLDASLVAILPFKKFEYIKDFKTKADREAFNFLYSKAEKKLVLNDHPIPENDSRDEAYEKAGTAVVDTCEILVTIWDGKPARGRGGTAEIIKYACSINRPVVWINALQPGLPPVMVTNIQDNTKIKNFDDPEFFLVACSPILKHAAEWSSRFLQVAEFNRDRVFNKRGFDKIYTRNKLSFEQIRNNTKLVAEDIDPLINSLLPHYARADYLAIKYLDRHIRSASWLYRLAAIAVAVAVIQTLFFPSQVAWVLLEILALVGAVVWFRISMIQHWHEKWLNYRHLAERIRILFFHSLVSKQSLMPTIQNQQLPFYPGPGGWVLDAFDQIKHDLRDIEVKQEKFHGIKKFVLDGWIEDQAEYHRSNAVTKSKLAHRNRLLIGGMLIVTLLAAILHLLKVIHDPILEHLIVSIVIILPSFAAAQHAIEGIHDNERIATRSVRMNQILNSIKHIISQADTWDELSSELQHAEDIMSAENHEWCVSLSFRRISLPV